MESTHGRGYHGEETENLTASTELRLFKRKSQSPSPAATAVEGTLVISIAADRAGELYVDKKEAGEERDKYSYLDDVSLLLERGDHGLSTRARGNDEPGRHRSMVLVPYM